MRDERTLMEITAILAAIGPVRLAALCVTVVLSVASLVLYARDKAAAAHGRWRTPEATLHLVALLGGWPGALAAQRIFRHKTRKQPFRAIFWCTVVANSGMLAWLAFR